MRSYREAYFSMIYINCFLGLYEFVEVSSSASNPASWRLASYSRKSVTLVCQDTPKTAACPRIPDSVDPGDAQTRCRGRRLRNTLLGGHAPRQVQVERDAERSNLGRFCVREEPARPGRCVHDDREPVHLFVSGSLAVKLARLVRDEVSAPIQNFARDFRLLQSSTFRAHCA